MPTLIDTHANARVPNYTLPTVQDGDVLIYVVNRDTSFAGSYTPAGFLTLQDTVAGVGVWRRDLVSGDTGETIAHTSDAATAAWVVRDLTGDLQELVYGIQDNISSSVSFPQTIADDNAQGTPPYPAGVHLSAGFAFYSPTTGTPGTFGEARITAIDGYTADASDFEEFVQAVTPFRNVSHAVAAYSDLDGNPASVDWTYEVSVGGPRTRLEVVRIIYAGVSDYVGMLGGAL